MRVEVIARERMSNLSRLPWSRPERLDGFTNFCLTAGPKIHLVIRHGSLTRNGSIIHHQRSERQHVRIALVRKLELTHQPHSYLSVFPVNITSGNSHILYCQF